MKIEPAVAAETKHIAIGTAAMCVIMIAIFALFGAMAWPVVWGALLGGGFTIVNFFLMALSVQKSMQAEKAKQARMVTVRSYTVRVAAMAVVIVLGFWLPCFQGFAVVIPMIFPRITIILMRLASSRKKETV